MEADIPWLCGADGMFDMKRSVFCKGGREMASGFGRHYAESATEILLET